MLRNDDYKQRLRLVAADESHFNANVVALKLCKYAKKLIHATQLYGLNQLINEPTRVTEHTRSAIDFVFVNNSHRICSINHQLFAILLYTFYRKIK